MPRKSDPSSRRPGPTEDEIALKWELRRTRAELAALQREQGEVNKDGFRVGDRLSGEPRARLLLKIERMWQNLMRQEIPEAERCAECGGINFEQSETAMQAIAAREAADGAA